MEQKMKEEKILLLLCFLSTLKKHLQPNQYNNLFFRNPSHKNKICQFSISVLFRFI